MEVVKLKCDLCGKEIIGTSKEHAEYLLKIHKANRHQNELEKQMKDEMFKSMGLNETEASLIELFRKANDEDRKKVFGVLIGKLKTFEWQFQTPPFEEIVRMAEEIDYDLNDLINDLLVEWWQNNKNFEIGEMRE